MTQRFRAAVAGIDVDLSVLARTLYAYDASNYRVPPVAVARPRTIDETRRILMAACADGLSVTCRGAGTSMAGNAVGPGVVLDFSRYLNQVVDIDPAARIARVEPGIVLDDLQAALQPHGLRFAPDPSSHRRATIGGMVGNDACGNRSVKYGRTVEHVVALDLVLADGSRLVAERGGVRAHDPDDRAATASAGRLEAELRALVTEQLAAIRVELGRIPRQVSGFQLQHLLPERGFDVPKVLVGTEGTCAVIVGITLALVPTAPAALLLVMGYENVVAAASDVPAVLGSRPAAVEGMDESIVAAMRIRRGPGSVAGLPAGRAWLFVELEGDDHGELERRGTALLQQLHEAGRMLEGRAVSLESERASLWRVRENGAGLATRRADGTQTWAGWEDSAVSPDRLAGYLADLRGLLDAHHLTGAFYGHFGAGCVHVRIDFDLASAGGVERMRTFVTEAARLVRRHGGSASGEHGDGRSRSELLGLQYSPTMTAAFARMKAAFDPGGLLNPGIVVAAVPLAANLVPIGTRRDLGLPAFSFPHDQNGLADAAGRCVGIGLCRSDHGDAMCPSFRATHDEKDSTRGRARVLQEMISGSLIDSGRRSDEVREALDLCLSCKACAGECPVGVDMATYKAEFLHHHYRGRLRPRSHYSLGWLPLIAWIAGFGPGVVNALVGLKPLRRVLCWAGGVTTARRLPRFSGRRAARRTVPARPGPADAVLFTDTFTRAFRPELLGAAHRSLAAAGVVTRPVEGLCCGLTWISTGQLSVAERVLRRTVAALDTGPDDPGRPVIVLEPSCAAALRKDAPELLASEASRRVAARIRTFAEVIDARMQEGWDPPVLEGPVALQVHCHERAVLDSGAIRRVLTRLAAGPVVEADGCCGLAGNFGFEREHYDTSMAVAALSLEPMLSSSPGGATVLADGFSCQSQIEHLSTPGTARPQHLAQVIDRALAGDVPADPRS